MRRNLFTSLFILSCFFSLSAQELGTAVVISNDGTNIGQLYYRQFIREMRALHDEDLVIYDWDQKNHQLKLSTEAATPEKPVEIAYFVEQQTPPFDIPNAKVHFYADNEGFATGAFISIEFQGIYKIKAVDIKTGKILMATLVIPTSNEDDSNSSSLHKSTRPQPLAGIRIDLKKYVKRKQKKSALDRNRSLQYKMIKSNQKALSNAYWDDAKKKMKSISFVTQKIDSLLHPIYGVFDIEIPDIEAKKINKLNVLVGENSGVKKFKYLDLYSTQTINGKQIPFLLTKLFVRKIENGKAYCEKSWRGYSSEEMANDLRAGKDHLFAVEAGVVPYSKTDYSDEDKVNVAIGNSDCESCTFELEQDLMKAIGVNLLDRSINQEMTQLLDLYKDGRFVDYHLDDAQDKQLGVSYLFSIKDHFLSITDIKTGQMSVVDEMKSGFDARGYTLSQAWRKGLLDFTGKPILLLEVTKQKKNKVQGITAFHPFGFTEGERFNISILTEEKVAGKVISKKETIANAYTLYTYGTGEIGLIAIMGGGKELSKAIKEGKQLVFDSAIIRK